jgi:transposase
MELTTIGLDISKRSFEVFGRDNHGRQTVRKSLRRDEVLGFFGNLRECLIGIEACGGAHYWARELTALGHTVKLISPQFVKPYVKSNKNDKADAEAICEAVSRPGMRFVGIKTTTQQDILSIHRVRERLIKTRTALSSEIRGLLGEYGVVLPQGIGHIRSGLSERLEQNSDKLTPMTRQTVDDLLEEFHHTDSLIDRYDQRLRSIHRGSDVSKKLGTIPGVGEVIATAIIGAAGNPDAFKNGRQFAAWLGLVPRQHSTGGKPRLLGISKRGDPYIRKQLVHGARSVVRMAHLHSDKRSIWIQKLKARKGANRTVVAVANKNARVIWAILKRETRYYEQVDTQLAAA